MISSFIRRASKDLLPGGLADNIPDSEFPPDQLAIGMEVEKKEHFNPDKSKGHSEEKANAKAKEIAKDHMVEFSKNKKGPYTDSHYYTDLLRMEKEHESETGKKSSLHALSFLIRQAKDRGWVAKEKSDRGEAASRDIQKAEKIVEKQKGKGNVKNQWGLVKTIYDNIKRSK